MGRSVGVPPPRKAGTCRGSRAFDILLSPGQGTVTEKSGPYGIIVNGVRYEVHIDTLSVPQIHALADIPLSMGLILEGKGMESDVALGPEDLVSLKEGDVAIYGRPPTSFGR